MERCLIFIVEIETLASSNLAQGNPSPVGRLNQSCLQASLVIGYETLARAKLASMKFDEVLPFVQSGLEAIDKCKGENLFGPGKSFFEPWKNLQLCLATLHRHNSSIKEARNIYRTIQTVNEACIEAMEGEGDIAFESDDNAGLLAIVKS